jgi:hypothetical protein
MKTLMHVIEQELKTSSIYQHALLWLCVLALSEQKYHCLEPLKYQILSAPM